MINIKNVKSSYSENNYGKVFWTLVRAFRPTIIVELGVLNGYSALHMGASTKHNLKLYGYGGTVDCYDLWDQYPYNHGTKSEVQKSIDSLSLQEYVKLHDGDAYTVHEKYNDNHVHLLHVDISNDGETIEKMMELWHKKIVMQGMIIFEGGSEERDKVDWMLKYSKKPIALAIKNNPVIQKCYLWGIYQKFPSLTVMVKKGE